MRTLRSPSPRTPGRSAVRGDSFEELVQLQDRDLKQFLREIPNSTLILALHGMSQDFKNTILSSFLERKIKILNAAIDNLQDPSKQDIQDARKEIAILARVKLRDGSIRLSKNISKVDRVQSRDGSIKIS